MIKTIDQLIPDIYEVLKGKGGWDKAATEFLSERISTIAEDRFASAQKVRNYVSPSNLGSPDRKLWLIVNEPHNAEELSAETLGTFFYGDLLEQLVISLAIAAGHRVDGLQEPIDVHGIKGSGDCIIDGVVVDIKSSSDYNFDKFKYNRLKGYYKWDTKLKKEVWVPQREVDSFNYISQLSSYLYGYKNDPRVVTKDRAAFLVVKKSRFKLCLDSYDLSAEVAQKEQEVEEKLEMVKEKEIPWWCHEPVPEGKSGNMKLAMPCSYCQFRKRCWPDARTFIYSTGPTYLTEVKKIPKVPEVTQ